MDTGDDTPFSQINVVPLVDIILVVLIIFMVTAPMIVRPSINVNLPKAASGEDTKETPLNLTIEPSGNVLLNGKAASDTEIAAYVGEQVIKNPDMQAVIAADKDTPHGKVVAVIDIVKSAGCRKFAISIDKK
jgi:biopolymer transport protein ExbD